MFGPSFTDGHNNDASIIKQVIDNNEQHIKEWLHADDIVIVDCGFRDAVHVMEELELQVKIPAFLKGKKQFSTEEAYGTRSIAKDRWVIDSGMLQRFFSLYYEKII